MKKKERKNNDISNFDNVNFDTINYVRNERKNLSKRFSKMTNEEILNYLKENTKKSEVRPSA